jgi:hypothetical protein
MTTEQDLVLIYLEDQPLAFARVEAIEPDVKPGWYLATLLLLQVPVQLVTWILRDEYINGDAFTMDGKKMRLEKVESPALQAPSADDDKEEEESGKSKVIAFTDFRKK